MSLDPSTPAMEPYTIPAEHQHPNTIKVLDQFDCYRTAYKHVNSQPIYAFFIVPKNLPSGPRPLLVRWHGGGFVEGEAEASMRPFFMELALKHGAVILTADYRLRPEHSMTDGINDARSFWKWVEDGSAAKALNTVYPSISLDAANLMIGGESGGGYYTVQTALLGMTSLPIKVLFVQYPAVSLVDLLRGPPYDNKPDGKGTGITIPVPPTPYSVVEEHLASLPPGTVCSRAPFASRMHLNAALLQSGRFCDIEGDNSWIDPMSALDIAPKLPPVLLYHSKDDEAVPWQHTAAFAEKLKKLQPDVPLFLTFQHGDHVFDKNHNMETPWLKEPLEFVQKYWPAVASSSSSD